MRIVNVLRALVACSIFILVLPVAAAPVLNFIPQHHADPFNPKRFDERVAESQFEVLRALSRLPGATVFAEGETEDIVERRILVKSPTLGNLMPLLVFFGDDPGILSKRYDQLNLAQRTLLYEFGGARLALDMGMINRIKAVDSEAEFQADLDWAEAGMNRLRNAPNSEKLAWANSPEFHSHVIERRELEVLKRTRNFVLSAEYRNEPLAVVYGGAHEFEAAPKFEAYFELSFTRVCEKRVIEMPSGATDSKMELILPDGTAVPYP